MNEIFRINRTGHVYYSTKQYTFAKSRTAQLLYKYESKFNVTPDLIAVV